METSASGPAAHPFPLHHHALASGTIDMKLDADTNQVHTPARQSFLHHPTQPTSWLETPTHVTTDHGLLSNVRDTAEQHMLRPDPTEVVKDHSPTGSAPPYPALIDPAAEQAPASEEHTAPTDAAVPPTEEPEFDEDEDHTLHEAYAMLEFRDCYTLINSRNLIITRDENYLKSWYAQRKEAKKRSKAQEALDAYALEPSQPSQPDDEDRYDPFGEGESLEGRPAPGLLSNYSEQGGPVAYQPPSDDGEALDLNAEKSRRRYNVTNSSSANSIAPQDLHFIQTHEMLETQPYYDNDGETDPHEWAQLPVHTARPEDIKKISREHLIFSYDGEIGKWVLKVVGKTGVVVNGEFYPCGTEGLELGHRDDIYISTLHFQFLLPNTGEPGSSSSADDRTRSRLDDLHRGSPTRRNSAASQDAADSSEEDEQHSVSSKPRTTIKLKFSSKKKDTLENEAILSKGKGKGKSKQLTEEEGKALKLKSNDAATASKEPKAKVEKGRQSMPSIEFAQDSNTEPPKADKGSPPANPVNLEPGSLLHDLAPEDRPEKRKGPGRPPKNGLLSKRDEAGVRRKQKEYERNGWEWPGMNAILDEVRREQRAKDLAAKASARGEAVQDIPVPSIEPGTRPDGESNAPQDTAAAQRAESGSPTAPGDRAASPKLHQPARSFSPMKPMHEFTEEELKKPPLTYIYILEEMLQSIEGGQADLQTLYDKIQKRYPYYKYGVVSNGWQSSVRHNLLSCDRFKEAGKSGKGKFWTIDPDHPLDNRKRRPTPPPRPQPSSMGYSVPNMPPNQQYGQSGLAAINAGQTSFSGQAPSSHGQYYSPYGPHQNGHRPPPPGSDMMAQNQQSLNGQYPPQAPPPAQRTNGQENGSHTPQSGHSSLAQPTQTPFQSIVDEIMRFRQPWMHGAAAGSPEHTRRAQLFDRSTQYFSNIFHGMPSDLVSEDELQSEPFLSMKAIFDRHTHLRTTPAGPAGTKRSAEEADGPSAIADNDADTKRQRAS